MKKGELEDRVRRLELLLKDRVRYLYEHCPRNYATESVDSLDNDHSSGHASSCGYDFCVECRIADDLKTIFE